MRTKKNITIFLLFFLSKVLLNATIIGSKHDLSSTNYYGSGGSQVTEVCVFCHTPHGSNSDIGGPLWNRRITDSSVFTLYDGTNQEPNNPSLVCLSCHDGVSANGDVSAVDGSDMHKIINSPGAGHENSPLTPNCTACHFRDGNMFPGRAWTIGPDLTDDHPVSVSYESAKNKNPASFQPDPLNGLKLYSGNVECTSCHDPHSVEYPAFLRVANTNSELCNSCHIK